MHTLITRSIAEEEVLTGQVLLHMGQGGPQQGINPFRAPEAAPAVYAFPGTLVPMSLTEMRRAEGGTWERGGYVLKIRAGAVCQTAGKEHIRYGDLSDEFVSEDDPDQRPFALQVGDRIGADKIGVKGRVAGVAESAHLSGQYAYNVEVQ